MPARHVMFELLFKLADLFLQLAGRRTCLLGYCVEAGRNCRSVCLMSSLKRCKMIAEIYYISNRALLPLRC